MALSVRKSLRKVVGLRNLGNTCYLNAVLQSLASISSLHIFLAENPKHVLNRQPLTKALRETIAELSLSHGKTIKPPESLFAVRQLSGMLSSKEQQDAHELMQLLMNILDEEHGQSCAPTLANASLLQASTRKPSHPSSSSSYPHPTPSSSTVVSSLLRASPFAAPYHPFLMRGSVLQTPKPSFNLNTIPIRTFMSSARESFPVADLKMPSKNPFYGLLANTMKCNDCGRESNPHYQKFFGLSLPMPDTSELHTTRDCTLEKCLDLFVSQMVEGVAWDHVPLQKVIPTTAHLIAGDAEMFIKSQSNIDPIRPFDIEVGPIKPLKSLEQMASARHSTSPPPPSHIHCSTTGVCNAFLNCNIAKPPTSLCLHLRRLIALSGGNLKLETHVKFPLRLNLSAYCKTGLSGDQDHDADYRLTSVIVHNGDVNGGHFTCFRHISSPEFKDKEEYHSCINAAISASSGVGGSTLFGEEGAWFNISDDKPSLVEESEVLSCNAYMLYYEQLRRDTTTAASSGLRLGVWNRNTSSPSSPPSSSA